MEIFKLSAKGSRTTNQDYINGRILDKDGTAVYVVADGMGGYDYGDVAAKTTVEAIIDFISSNHERLSPGTLLKDAFKFANDSLCVKRMSLGAKEMGCVVVALLLKDDVAYMAWVGDSRIYFFREGQMVFRTTDHSMVEELSKVRALTAADLERYSAVVTRAIMGDDEDVTPDLMKTGVMPGDIFVLCSDGLHKEMSILDIALKDPDALRLDLANRESQFSDNFSLIRVSV